MERGDADTLSTSEIRSYLRVRRWKKRDYRRRPFFFFLECIDFQLCAQSVWKLVRAWRATAAAAPLLQPPQKNMLVHFKPPGLPIHGNKSGKIVAGKWRKMSLRSVSFLLNRSIVINVDFNFPNCEFNLVMKNVRRHICLMGAVEQLQKCHTV